MTSQKCIVKHCRPQSPSNDEYISFFNLPRNEAMRKVWLEKVGDVGNLSEIRFHSFVDPAIAKLKVSDWDTLKKARRLSPYAIPTLNLNLKARRGKKRDREGNSKDKSSSPKHKRRPTTKSPDNRSTDGRWKPKVEEFENMITELIKKLQYTESLVNFYQNSSCDDRKEILELKAQCATFATQLKRKQPAKDEPSVEIEMLRKQNEKLRAELESAKADMKDLSERQQDTFALKQRQAEKDESSVEITKLRKQNEKLQTELASAKKDMEDLLERQEDTFALILKAYFTHGQIRCIIEGCKQTTWSIDDFAAAISLRNVSPRAYRYLRNELNFPLPSLLSLRQWALVKFDTSEGFLKDVLAVMRKKGKTFSEIERVAVITFAEMSLTHELYFDSKSQQIIGPCTKVLVIMARGLFGNWKQPIYYKFDQPMTKTILNEAVTLLNSANYRVVAAICDIGNERVWSNLGITVEKHFIPHPVRTDEIIYAFADVPHLLKLIRNWCIDDGFLIQGCTEPLTCNALQTIVLKSTDLIDPSITHKLTQRVIDARNDLSQAVWPAARIWSRSTAKSVELIGKRNLSTSKDYQKYSDFILAVNNWFDVHNSKMLYGRHRGVNAYGVDEDNQQMRLVLMTSHMESMRVGSRRNLMPFQEGVMISNASLRGLHAYLKEKFPNDYQYIITRRLQQDVLENFFTYIRAMGAAEKPPSPHEFRCRLRWYILGVDSHTVFENNPENEEDVGVCRISSNHSTMSSPKKRSDVLRPSKPHNNGSDDTDRINALESSSLSSITSDVFQSRNTLQPEYEYEPDSDAEILLTEELFLELMNMSPFLASAENENNSPVDNFDDNLHELDEINEVQQLGSIREKSTAEATTFATIADAGLTHIAGYVAYRFRNKYRYLGEQAHSLGASTPNELLDWVQDVSKGQFPYPGKELLQATRIVEKCFTQLHKAEFSGDDQVINKVALLAKNRMGYPDNIPDEVLQCLVRTRTYIRIREINKKMFARDTEMQD